MTERIRSPRYPSISLREAEVLAQKLYDKDGTNTVDREVAVKHMGYTTLNGASATILATLNQYGLTGGAGKGMVRLTEAAIDILEPHTEASRRQALALAARAPSLFSELFEQFPGKVSESALRAYLVRQGFKTPALKQVVPAFLETREYVSASGESESYGETAAHLAESPRKPTAREEKQMNTHQTVAPAPPLSTPLVGKTETRRMVFDTEEGETTLTFPDGLSLESVEEIEQWLALVTKRLRRGATQ